MPSRPEIVEVNSYAGYRAEEKPLWFVICGQTVKVKKIIAQWRDEYQDCFRVSSEKDELYLLRYDRQNYSWTVEGCKQVK